MEVVPLRDARVLRFQMVTNGVPEEQIGVGRPETFFWRAMPKRVPRRGNTARQKKCRSVGGPAPGDWKVVTI